jgi:hypothetical protein
MSILGYPNLENKPSELPQILVAGSSGIVTGWLSTKPGDIAGANFPGGKMIFIRFISMVLIQGESPGNHVFFPKKLLVNPVIFR